MEPSKPMDISSQMRRGSLDSNMGRESMESSGSMRDSRPASFEGGKSVDEARLQMWKANRAKKAWAEPDPTTAFWSA
jgi:hypothetical protein